MPRKISGPCFAFASHKFVPQPPFVHPETHTLLTREDHAYVSPRGEKFPDARGIPCFLSTSIRQGAEEERGDFVNSVKTFLRRSPTLYRLLILLISPVCFVGMTARKFVKQFPEGAAILNVGAGVHRYCPDMVNLDIYPYRGIDVVADAMHMPYADNAFDGVICECLLEHVPEPERIVQEILRVLKPGGRAFIVVPFLYPFHACPNDFHRWTKSGMRELCKGSIVEDIAPLSGPVTALVAQLATLTAITLSFGSEKLYSMFSMILLPVFAPLKIFDFIVGKFPTAIHGAASFTAVVRKQ